MRQAITTKWLAPTNSRGSRVKASAAAGSVTVQWDYALNVDANHMAAARALVEKMGWGGQWVGGSMPGWLGYVFVGITGAVWGLEPHRRKPGGPSIDIDYRDGFMVEVAK